MADPMEITIPMVKVKVAVADPKEKFVLILLGNFMYFGRTCQAL